MWHSARGLGWNSGTVSVMALDWTIETDLQVKENDPFNSQIIVAAETVWLKQIVDPFVTTFVSLLSRGEPKEGYFVFIDRSTPSSLEFSSSSEVLEAFKARGCHLQLIATKMAPKEKKIVNIFKILSDKGGNKP